MTPWRAPDDVEVAAATLVCLPDITPSRLRRLLARFGGPVAALEAVRCGEGADVLVPGCPAGEEGERRQLAARWERADPEAVAAVLVARRTRVLLEDRAGFPIAEPLPDRPPILLAEGERADALTGPRVAVVGTRSATPHGMADARELGEFLAHAGVTVVSGLAIGIDAAAHGGAISASGPVVGVVATGLDIVYPRRHVALFDRVRHHGLVLGETGFGVGPTRSRFPVRNRIIAALADVVVVVEATATGGARITARFAADYGRPVLSVPGSRRNSAAAGTNALLADGAHPLLEWSDVMVALGLTPGDRRRAPVTRDAPSGDAKAVLAALGGEAATPDQLASRTGLTPGQVAVALRVLDGSGWIERAHGMIWPR